jgi:hypothetical protein
MIANDVLSCLTRNFQQTALIAEARFNGFLQFVRDWPIIKAVFTVL